MPVSYGNLDHKTRITRQLVSETNCIDQKSKAIDQIYREKIVEKINYGYV